MPDTALISARELDSLAEAFLNCTLPKAQWTHLSHLKVGAWHVHRYGAEEGLRHLRDGIRRLNGSHGVPNSETRGYHETITAVYVRLIEQFLREGSREEAVSRILESDLRAKDFLFHFYSRERLLSVQARKEWLEPDIQPLALPVMQLHMASERHSLPWKNGQGWTTDVAVFPEGSGLENFDWRISLAGTIMSGPFSRFPGIDRSLVLLHGSLTLNIDKDPPLVMKPDSRPVSFPGEVPVTAILQSDEMRDLNVMTRRSRFTHTVSRFHTATMGPPAASHTIVFSIASGDAATLAGIPGRFIKAPFDWTDCYLITMQRICP